MDNPIQPEPAAEQTLDAGGAPDVNPAERYATGEIPKRGDVIVYAEKGVMHKEASEEWIVTSTGGDMVRAKCKDAPAWRQAFYTAKMKPTETF